MSSPAPSDANGDDAQRNELLADHADVLPGISDYVGDDAPLTAGQNNSTIDGLGESMLGAPKPGAGQARQDSPQNDNGDDTAMNDNGTQAPIDPNAAIDTTEPAIEPTDPNDPNAPIEIIVTDGNNQMAFKIRKNTKMGKMIARYAEHLDRNRATMRFLFDGDKVVDGDTPASLEMEDGNVVEVVAEQIGG